MSAPAGMSAQDVGAFDRFLSSFQVGLFGVFFVATKRPEKEKPHLLFFWLRTVFEFSQLLVFPFSPLLGWGEVSSMTWLLYIISFSNPLRVLARNFGFLSPYIFLCIEVALAFFVGCLAYCVTAFAKGDFSAIWPLKVLRATAP